MTKRLFIFFIQIRTVCAADPYRGVAVFIKERAMVNIPRLVVNITYGTFGTNGQFFTLFSLKN